MDGFKHWSKRWRKELDSQIMIEYKEDFYEKRSNYCRRKDKGYWRRKIEKHRNKKSMSKWNKRYLLSLNGY